MMRFAFIPLFVLLVLGGENHTPLIKNDPATFIIMASMALTNGYFGSLAMMYGPVNVESYEKEKAGAIMVSSYLLFYFHMDSMKR